MNERPVELRRVLQGLHEHGVDYVLFGAVAMLFYGHVRNTADVDIVVRGGEENLARLNDWLMSIDARLALRPERRFGTREQWEMLKGANATVITTCGQLDLVQRLDGLPPFDQLVAESEIYEQEGVRVPVMNRRTLIELKKRRGSRQDLADVEAIELLDTLDG